MSVLASILRSPLHSMPYCHPRVRKMRRKLPAQLECHDPPFKMKFSSGCFAFNRSTSPHFQTFTIHMFIHMCNHGSISHDLLHPLCLQTTVTSWFLSSEFTFFPHERILVSFYLITFQLKKIVWHSKTWMYNENAATLLAYALVALVIRILRCRALLPRLYWRRSYFRVVHVLRVWDNQISIICWRDSGSWFFKFSSSKYIQRDISN